MMQLVLLFRGLAIGFALAAPVGPVGILCIRRALADGRYAAFVAGLGAALADTVFGAVIGLGLTMISGFLLHHEFSIRLLGGMFLIGLGLRAFLDQKCPGDEPRCKRGMVKDFISTFFLTLSNPATILGALGVFAAFGAIDLNDPAAASVLIFGVFLGSTLWWLILSAAAGAVRSRFSPERLRTLNRGSGVVLAITGCGILASLLIQFL
jgi:threonine/homoserine/homoserine lactone efflux protein